MVMMYLIHNVLSSMFRPLLLPSSGYYYYYYKNKKVQIWVNGVTVTP